MDARVLAAVLVLILFASATAVLVKTLYHFWIVINGIRSDRSVTAGFLGPLALLNPALFEDHAQPHLRKLAVWAPICFVLVGLLFALQTFATRT